ncbi:hypothetical protein JTB14_025293 [Gonioctena quinquepunctata]|nr:hypothetical protein JTB14_025293 [Gonioctena quinquepunctata]
MLLRKSIILLGTLYMSGLSSIAFFNAEPNFYTVVTFYLVLAINGSHSSSSGSQVAETGKNTSCRGTLNLLNCYYMKAFSGTRDIEIRSRYVPGRKCDIRNVSFSWVSSSENETLCNCSKYHDGNDILMELHSIGYYRIVSKTTEYDNNGFENVLSDECIFTILREKLVPIIAVDGEIALSSGKLLSDDDVDISLEQNGSLVYKLSYGVIGTHRSSFHNRTIRNDTLPSVLEEYALDGLMYNFKLSVKTGESNIRQSSIRTDRVKRQNKFEIVCVGNCEPDIDVAKKTTVRVESTDGSEIPEGGVWRISSPDIDLRNDTIRSNQEFTLKPHKLVFGKSYTVFWQGGSESPSYPLKTHIMPRIHSCDIDPKTGYSVKTVFHVNCSFTLPNIIGRNVELYAVNNGKEFLLASGFDMEKLPFVLNENDRVKVKLIDQHHFSHSRILDVTVKSKRIPSSEEAIQEKIQEAFFDENSEHSLYKLRRDKKYEQLLQTARVYSEEVLKLPHEVFNNTAHKYNKVLLEIMQKVPIASGTRSRQVVTLMGNIAKQYANGSDSDIAKFSTDLCERASREYQNYIEADPYKKFMLDEIKETTREFSGCFISSSSPNLGEVEVPVSNITAPTKDLDLGTEDDYRDDQNTSKSLTKFDYANTKMVSLCYINARSMTLIMSPGDATLKSGDDIFEITATKRLGKESNGTTITSQNVTLLVSEDFMNYGDEEINILMCTIRKNPFWWVLKERINTSVVMIKFLVVKKEIHQFQKPFFISMENNERNFSSIRIHEAVIPRQTNETLATYVQDFEKMAIFRIDVPAQQGYVIEFLGLRDDDIIDVYVSDFVKPTLEEFKAKSTQMDETNTRTFVNHEHDYHSWDYLCILPNDKMGDQELIVKFRVYALYCVYWKSSTRTWVFSCGVANTSSLNRFDCICYHSSILAGRVTENFIREEITEILVEHELALQINLVILVSVAVVFFIYCVMLMIISLSANWEHILNSPDPNKKILQKNQEDWFFLTTEDYLGPIEKLEIWFDCAGFKPSWYCSEIEVIDIRKNYYWWFNVKHQFEISSKEKYFFTAYPEKLDEEKKTPKVSQNRCSFEGNHMWNIFRHEEASFSKSKRLTIMLSISMTTYVVLIFIYGLPELENSDNLGEYVVYGLHTKLIWATICSLVLTFFSHLPIVHFFRFPYQEKRRGNQSQEIREYPHSDIICWCSLVLFIIFSMTVLVVFGFWVPHITVLLWFTSAMASLLIYIFLLENILRLLYSFTGSKERRIRYISSRIQSVLDYVDDQRVLVMKKFGYKSLRPKYEQLYRLLSESRIKEQKYWTQIKGELLEIIQDVIMVSIYVLLLYVVILEDRDPMSRISNQEVIDLTVGVHSRTVPQGDSIYDTELLENYTRDTFIYSMQSQQWYGEFYEDPGMTIDNTNKYIGIVRLRQLRSDNHRARESVRVSVEKGE